MCITCYVPMLLPGKVNVCLSLRPDYAINIMHQHVHFRYKSAIFVSAVSKYNSVFRDTAETSDGGSIHLTLLNLVVRELWKLYVTLN
jgi:hypothetical protein